MQSTKSIGFYRNSDGDFAILATLNNNDGNLSDSDFGALTASLVNLLDRMTGEDIIVLDRQDAPDYVDAEGDGHSY